MPSSVISSSWFSVTLSLLSLVALYINIFSIPPITLLLIRETGITHFQAGMLMTVYTVSYCVGNIFAGMLSDKYGAKIIMVSGLLLAFFSSMMFTSTNSFHVMLVSRGLIGLSAASMTSPCMIYLLSFLPPRKRGLGVSGHLSSLTLGSGIVLLMTPLLIRSWPWRPLLQLYALLGLIPSLLFLFWGKGLPRGTTPSHSVSGLSKASILNGPVLLLSAILFVTLFQIGGTLTWLAPWLEERCLLSPIEVGVGAMTFALAGIPSAILGGYLSSRDSPDRRERIVRLSMAGMLISASTVAFVWLETYRSFPLILTVIVLSRWGSFMSMGPLLSMVPKLVHPSLSGLAVGFTNSVALAGGFLSSLLGGYVIERTGQYRLIWLLFGVTLLVSTFVLHPWFYRKTSGLQVDG
jgi:DHA1 family putative efflux transporter-like MFS transporter